MSHRLHHVVSMLAHVPLVPVMVQRRLIHFNHSRAEKIHASTDMSQIIRRPMYAKFNIFLKYKKLSSYNSQIKGNSKR